MPDNYIDWREKQNIEPIELVNKRKYYLDIMNIEHSFTGRADMWGILNAFVLESAQLLINAIMLFEKGFSDCAYYSLREAIEISTTIIYLSDIPDNFREQRLSDWKQTRDFPMRSRMLKQLSKNGCLFIDMKEKMSDLFQDIDQINKELNKYVHKQGLEHLYIARNHPININKKTDLFIDEFKYYLKKCIGIVAVMRLALDPFPILLMDKEILYRCFDSMTDPYSQEFVDEYIGQNTIDAYKTTEIYKETYDSFIGVEQKTEAVFNVVKHQYIDSRKMDEILQQLSLMSKDDIISVLMVYACDKVIKTYCMDGLLMYFTEKNTNRKAMSWSGLDFRNFAEAEIKINQPYDESYISVFLFDNERYYVEHNEQLDSEDIANIVGLVTGALFNINESCTEESH